MNGPDQARTAIKLEDSDSDLVQGSNPENKRRKSSKKARLTLDVKQKIIDMHKEGQSNALGDKEDSDLGQGSDPKKKRRKSSKKARLTLDVKQEIVNLHKEGQSNSLIAEYIGCSRPTVVRIIREYAAKEQISTASSPPK
ncbi:hypothetical protein V5799_019765 [Amblyomma americanum]|uniref:Uncharacterized protein n=1 Tax=Amblyomma americanum TaxID=6943 RepID=A0AAQ4EWC8_AMBAM